MRLARSLAGAALIFGFGYLCGNGHLSLRSVTAQDEAKDPAGAKIHESYRRLVDAKEALESNSRYETVTDGLNAFLILSGGGNAKTDLESGRGVDPETFAALYAGRALPEIQPLLSTNEHGQIMYNNEVVRMYSKARLQQSFADRVKYIERAE
ncbi:hypothetical protein [Planctomicrobium sp. SH527]|uniref:hypothetical protein n=1 Tax=Planctomicrobium sp. SH527 TaxID=3448123 RepID=UPI003F5B802B